MCDPLGPMGSLWGHMGSLWVLWGLMGCLVGPPSSTCNFIVDDQQSDFAQSDWVKNYGMLRVQLLMCNELV